MHSTFALPAQTGQQQENKGEVLDKLYMKVKPTVVIWDGQAEPGFDDSGANGNEDADSGKEADDVWDEMENADSEDEPEGRKKSKSR